MTKSKKIIIGLTALTAVLCCQTVYSENYSDKFSVYSEEIINSNDVSSFDISISPCVYNGNPQMPEIVISKDGTTLVKDVDYSVEVSDNVNAGKATATINGKGIYSGSVQKEFTIEPLNIKKCTISGISSQYTFTGKAIKPSVKVKWNNEYLSTADSVSVKYSNNLKKGTGYVIISGKDNFTGEVKKAFKILPKKITDSAVTGLKKSYTYTGNYIKPSFKVKSGSAYLKKNSDYTYSFAKNKSKGTAVLTIKGKGNYTGSIRKTFKILPKSIKGTKISGIKSYYYYTGKRIVPSAKVKYNGHYLKKNRDYSVYCKNNLKKGTALIKITGKGNFSGSVSKHFKIKSMPFTKCQVNGIKNSYRYVNKAIKPKVTVRCNGKILKKNRDYTVKYINTNKAGTGIVKIIGKGNYSGTITRKFSIYYQGWTRINGNKYYFDDYGNKLTGMQDIDYNTYQFDSNGVMQTGWKKIKGNYYLFNRNSGKMMKNTKADGIKIDSKGRAKKTKAALKKIETMMTANKIVKEITNPGDSMAVKREKCFNWIFPFPYHRFRELSPIYNNPGWEVDFANDIFKFKCGCCVSEASAAAFLFHEIGYNDVYVCHDTSHAWVEMNGYAYDPLFAEAKSYNAYYNVPISSYPLHAVGRRKI